FFFQAEDGIRGFHVTGVQTCALPISERAKPRAATCSQAPKRGSPTPGTPIFTPSWRAPPMTAAEELAAFTCPPRAKGSAFPPTKIGRASGREGGEGTVARGRRGGDSG